MTTASELFQNWRSRAHRFADSDPPPSSDRDTDLRRRHRRPRRRGDADFTGGGRRHPGSPTARHICNRHSQLEREHVLMDYIGTTESGTSNSSSNEAASTRVNRMRLTRNDRLPGAVLQAQARLLERLRGISLTRNRQTASSVLFWDEFAASNDLNHINSGDWEIETSAPYESPFSLYNAEEEVSSIQLGNNGKPPGLSCEAFHRLHQEMFKDVNLGKVLGASLECAICLERFCDGDSLTQLNCGHRFHPLCLEPWALICGDCPYCRARI